MFLTTNHLTTRLMLFVLGICGTNKKKSEQRHHRIDEELTFNGGSSTSMLPLRGTHINTRSHLLLCSPVKGLLCSSIILKLEYLGIVLGEILIWIPQAGMERAHPSVEELLAHGNILGGVKLISILEATMGMVIAWRMKTRPDSYKVHQFGSRSDHLTPTCSILG